MVKNNVSLDFSDIDRQYAERVKAIKAWAWDNNSYYAIGYMSKTPSGKIKCVIVKQRGNNVGIEGEATMPRSYWEMMLEKQPFTNIQDAANYAWEQAHQY